MTDRTKLDERLRALEDEWFAKAHVNPMSYSLMDLIEAAAEIGAELAYGEPEGSLFRAGTNHGLSLAADIAADTDIEEASEAEACCAHPHLGDARQTRRSIVANIRARAAASKAGEAALNGTDGGRDV